jgi:hypothetical protein
MKSGAAGDNSKEAGTEEGGPHTGWDVAQAFNFYSRQSQKHPQTALPQSAEVRNRRGGHKPLVS